MTLKPSDLARQGKPGGVRTTFRVHGDRALYTLRDSEDVQVSPAAIEGPNGDVDGIAVFCHGLPRYTISVDAACELYNRLGEVLDALEGVAMTTITETDILESLDFEETIPCGWRNGECPSTAAWIAKTGCCGMFDAFLCTPHRTKYEELTLKDVAADRWEHVPCGRPIAPERFEPVN